MRNKGLACDESWMRRALREAERCIETPSHSTPTPPTPDSASHTPHSALRIPHSKDVPVGAICVFENKIIGRGYNRREVDNDPTAHAEVLALREAARHLNNWRLDEVTLYVTLEPCPMCAGAIWLSRLNRLVFGAWDAKAGACGSLYDLPRDSRLNHSPQVRGGVLEMECQKLLKDFFQQQRSGRANCSKPAERG